MIITVPGGAGGTVTLPSGVTGVLAPANGGVESVSVAGSQYALLPFDVPGQLTIATGTTATVSGGTVRCGLFWISRSITFTRVRVSVAITSNGNHEYIGIWSADKGTLIRQITFTLGAGTGNLTVTVASTTLPPGSYWLGFSADQATSTLVAVANVTATPLGIANDAGGSGPYWGLAANTFSAGNLPPTLGVITSNAAQLPLVVLEP